MKLVDFGNLTIALMERDLKKLQEQLLRKKQGNITALETDGLMGKLAGGEPDA